MNKELAQNSVFLSKVKHTDGVMASKLRNDPNSGRIDILVCPWSYIQYQGLMSPVKQAPVG